MLEEEVALKINQLTVNYEKTPVLWDISLEIPKSHLVAIVGPNGAGKSTLIKASLGLIKPIAGKVTFFGRSLKKIRPRVGYVPQKETVDWNFPITVIELVLMGRYCHLGFFRWPSKEDRKIALNYLSLVGMDEFAGRQISELSGGQQQRVFLARALIQEADLYFMDEPFTGIDVNSTKVIVELLRDLKQRGKTVFVVHHDLESISKIFDWAILLNTSVIACGEIEKVFIPELIHRAYGKDSKIFDKAAQLTQVKSQGYSA
jgi:manganese/zinc/iron transport system ATP- binding protein